MPGGSDRLFRSLILTLLLLILFPSAAHANAGTALLWAGIFHLFIGNALIGTGEGHLLAWRYKSNIVSSIHIMIFANYVSAAAGYAVMMFGPEKGRLCGLDVNIYNLPIVAAAGLAVMFVLTVLIEWPFCRWALNAKSIKKVSWRTAFKASLLVQTVSYIALLPWFSSLSRIDFYRQLDIDKSLSFAHNIPAVVYYVSDNSIYSIRPDGTGRRKELELSYPLGYGYPFMREHKKTGRRELWLRGYPNSDADTLLAGNFSPGCRLALGKTETRRIEYKEATECYKRQDFRPKGTGDWDIRYGCWGAGGIYAENRKTGQEISTGIEIPFVEWMIGSQYRLPGDKVIYEFGPQIVVLDLNTRKVGILAMGESPLVVLENGGLPNEK